MGKLYLNKTFFFLMLLHCQLEQIKASLLYSKNKGPSEKHPTEELLNSLVSGPILPVTAPPM